MSWERIKRWFKSFKKIKNVTNKEAQAQHKTNNQTEIKTDNADYKDYTVVELRKIILIHYPPFTWEKVGLLLYKEFTGMGKNFTKLQDNDIIPAGLVKCISNALYMFYKKELPKE